MVRQDGEVDVVGSIRRLQPELRRIGVQVYSTSVSGAGHVNSSHVVRAWVTAYGYYYGIWDVAKVRLTYRYAVLR